MKWNHKHFLFPARIMIAAVFFFPLSGFAQDSGPSTSVISSPFEWQKLGINQVLKGLELDPFEGLEDTNIESYYTVQSSPYTETLNRLNYLRDAYHLSVSEALLELGIQDATELKATFPVELMEVYAVGPDGLMKTADDVPIKSLMKMQNGDLSSRFYFDDGFTVLVQTLRDGTTNGILKNADEVPVRGYMIHKNGERFSYEYDAQGQIQLPA